MKRNEKNEMIEGNQILKKQLEFYKSRDVSVHVEKKDGRFYNGKVLEVAGDMVILDDRKLGAVPIYFIQINVLEKFREEE